MFSIFSKKKPCPNSAPEEPQTQPSTSGLEDFVVLPKRPAPAPPSSDSLYPSFNAPPGGSTSTAASKKEVSFLYGVPFKLSKDFAGESTSDVIAMQLSEIMAHYASRLQIASTNYDFTTERSVLAEG